MAPPPRLQSLGHVTVSKKSPPVLPRPSKQRNKAEQVGSKEETAKDTSALYDDLEEVHESLHIDEEDEVNICEVRQQKVCK